MSEAYLNKLLKLQFDNISNAGFFQTFVWWVIDSKYGKTKRMDAFLADQIEKPSEELKALALELRDKTTSNYLDSARKTIYNIEKFTAGYFTYVADTGEEWLDAIDSYRRRKDDCEGQNGFMYVLCRLAGIPSTNLYCCVGNTIGGYHFWLLFFDSNRNCFVRLDTTIFSDPKEIKYKEPFALGSTYKSIDFIFNENGIWRFR